LADRVAYLRECHPGIREQASVAALLEPFEVRQQRIDGLRTEALHFTQPTGAGRFLEIVQRRDAELLVDRASSAGSKPGNFQECGQGSWKLAPDRIVELHSTGLQVLDDL
jgi:hypothetical protein